MDIESFRDYCIKMKGVTEEFPFDSETLVFKVMGKIFAIAPLERVPSQANLKCDPEWAEALREQYDGSILPGYHMNKRLWNTLHLEQLPEHLVTQLIDHSYVLVVAGFSRKLKAAWEALDD